MNKPKLMFSSRIFGNDVDRILGYAKKKGFHGIEWYLNLFRLRTNSQMRKAFFAKLDENSDLYYTFHLPTTDVEIAHKEHQIARGSLEYLKMNIEYLAPWLKGQQVSPSLVLHIGSNSIATAELDWERGLENLKELVDYAKERNGEVSLENLKVGWTTDPKTHLAMCEYAGTSITFDTGHAASNPKVLSGELNLVDYAGQLAERIHHVHFYSYEDLDQGKHIPPQGWDEIGAIWKKVVNLPSLKSIVLELSNQAELEQTFTILMANKGQW